MDDGPKGQACSLKLPCNRLIPDMLPHPHFSSCLVLEGRNQWASLS